MARRLVPPQRIRTKLLRMKKKRKKRRLIRSKIPPQKKKIKKKIRTVQGRNRKIDNQMITVILLLLSIPRICHNQIRKVTIVLVLTVTRKVTVVLVLTVTRKVTVVCVLTVTRKVTVLLVLTVTRKILLGLVMAMVVKRAPRRNQAIRVSPKMIQGQAMLMHTPRRTVNSICMLMKVSLTVQCI